MSLLLDALNRASKEKQKAAAAASQAEAPAMATAEPTFQAATQTVQPAAQVVPEAAAPSLASGFAEPLKWEEIPPLTPEPVHTVSAEAPRAAPPVLSRPVQSAPDLELTLVAAPPAAAAASMARFEPPPRPELSAQADSPPLAPPAHAPAPAQEPAASTPREPTFAAPVAPAPPLAPVPAQKPSEPVRALAPPPPAPVPSPAVPVPPTQTPMGLAAAPAVKSVPDGQRAQDIRRAYEGPASDARKGRRRVMALGGLAIGLALAFGSVFLGLWGDPAKWVGGPGLATVAPPPPIAVNEPAPPPVPDTPTESAQPGAAPTVSAPDAVANASAVSSAPESAAVSPPAAPVVPAAKPVGAVKAAASGQAAPAGPRQARAPGDVAPTVAAATAPASTNAAPAGNTKSSPNPGSTAGSNGTAVTGGNEVVLGANGRTTPNFVAKTRGPSALEQGYALLLEGRLDDAAAAYSQALRANADERDALLGMAYISQQKGQRDDAQSYYRRVLRQEPNNARALAALQALDSGSDPTLTASRTGDLAARQPDSAAAMAMAGNAFVRDGLLSNAAQAYARAQALEPANPLHAYNLAVALDRLGRYAPAAVQYERVLTLSATAPVAVRAYQIEDVRLRLAQLRQALAASTESAAL